ncbi:MAG: fatty acid desaturase, partial [Pseudomonadota bacterium]
NNNLHSVHHANPTVAWYDLPRLYHARRDEFLRRNRGYYYPSYGAVMRAHLLRAKEPVVHPNFRQ